VGWPRGGSSPAAALSGALEEIESYFATLELPAGIDDRSGRPFYVVLVVDPDTGQVWRYPSAHLSAAAVERQRSALSQLLTRHVPGWETIRDASALAHRHFPGVHSIAWDWAITAEGPLLLEGNAGWGTAMAQQLRGGLLQPGPGDWTDPGRVADL
jgi:putative polysaccharide biosynthesis protein